MNKSFFELARRISFKSLYKHRLGSVIVKKGKVLGLGYNSTRTHPRSNTPYHQTHAELSAILNSRLEDFTGCDIYVYRETPTGKIANSKCCIYCEKMIRSLGFKTIYYTNNNGYEKIVI